ncbi:unnamed protein product [Amoebophrya sp. A120]|nr:unnamed protein product [Amoebophrya sp. A120]|eukprot:GSA120T00008603001.1
MAAKKKWSGIQALPGQIQSNMGKVFGDPESLRDPKTELTPKQLQERQARFSKYCSKFKYADGVPASPVFHEGNGKRDWYCAGPTSMLTK